MAREINLVPDIKNEFIKTLKFRNFVFFLCIIVASVSLAVILIFISIAGGQQGFINAKQNTISKLEQKISDYSDLSDFLTIRDQLGNIASITENKVMMSRSFNILSALIPTGDNYINISELSIDLSEDVPTFTFDAQANANAEPFIDYNVLDSFKKSMPYMRYDYGEYVDREDNTIPAYCIIDSDNNGSFFRDAAKGYYAYWLIEGEGCNPASADEEESQDLSDSVSSDTTSSDSTSDTASSDSTTSTTPQLTAEELSAKTGYQIENYNGENVVRIWRTPQYTDWYKSNPNENEAYMDLDGTIHNIPHFNSSCIKYSGVENDNNSITWSATNETCLLVPNNEEGGEGIKINDSSNGRDADEQLVLRFSAVISFAPEVFNFNNHHMLALPPASRRNVTDSYSQIQSIFAERAADCEQDDTACITTPTSADNSNNSNSSDNNSNTNTEEGMEVEW